MDHIHFIGIGGSGLSAIARLLLEMGFAVSGSDRADSPFLSDLRNSGAEIMIGHNPANVSGANLVVRSSAIPDDNPEVVTAKEIGIPVLKRADFLGKLMEEKYGIAIAGTHGKTTTTAMMAWVLHALQQDPSFIVGGLINNLGVNAHAGKGDHFVIEADEYDHMFLGLKPMLEIVTNIEHDHPDCYPTAESFSKAFLDFVGLLPQTGILVACGQDPGAFNLIQYAQNNQINTLTYGIATNSDTEPIDDIYFAKATHIMSFPEGGFSFDAMVNNQDCKVKLQVPGIHNVLNSLAVLSVVSILGLSLQDAAAALGEFQGAGRRFEILGEPEGITIINDYAHHPTEIRATLAAARSRYPGRKLWAVWQPHTYSRTKLLHNEFSKAFFDADEVIVTEIFPSREPKEDYSSYKVVQDMQNESVQFIPGLVDVFKYLGDHLKKGDVLLILSAGDADQISNWILHHYQEIEVNHG